MRRYFQVATAVTALLIAGGANAQPADLPVPAATTAEFPPGVTVKETKNGRVYVDARGRTLYGMDMRTLVRWTTSPTKYCKDACAQEWEPLLAPAGSTPNPIYAQSAQGLGGGGGGGGQGQGQAGQGQGQGGQAAALAAFTGQGVADWTIAEGLQGPQWVYKRFHVVFTRKGDKPGSTAQDGAGEMMWNTLKYVPPVPKLVAPTNVSTVVKDGDYVLADKDGRVLFTGKAAGARWVPFAAGLASRGVGEWAVSRSGDAPQWLYRGKPVFVSQEVEPTQVPESAIILRP